MINTNKAMTQSITLKQAKRKVNAIREFYNHLALFILVTAILLVLKGNMVQWILEKSGNSDVEFLQWVDWNIMAIPIIWGAAIIVQGSYVFEFSLMKKDEKSDTRKKLQIKRQTKNH